MHANALKSRVLNILMETGILVTGACSKMTIFFSCIPWQKVVHLSALSTCVLVFSRNPTVVRIALRAIRTVGIKLIRKTNLFFS